MVKNPYFLYKGGNLLVCLLCILCLTMSCINILETNDSDSIARFDIHAEASQKSKITKTQINGVNLNWDDNDHIGIFVSEGLQYNEKLSFSEDSTFCGSLVKHDISKGSVHFIAYYPWHSDFSSKYIVKGTLPSTQTAPFDEKANYMLSEIIANKYDEVDFPSLNFTFSNQLFSLVKINIVNTNESLKDEKLFGVSLVSDKSLASDFTVQLFPNVKDPEFLPTNDSKEVSVEYGNESEMPVLGCGSENIHTFYAFVKSGEYDNFKVVVKTSTKVFTKSIKSGESIQLNRNTVTVLPTIDLNEIIPGKRVRTVIVWGDSITPNYVADYLQEFLGRDWIAYAGGVGGNSLQAIAGRHGGIPFMIKDSFYLPANSSEAYDVGKYVYSTWGSYGKCADGVLGQPIYLNYFFQTSYSCQLNPCIINGVECVMTYDSSTDGIKVRRLVDSTESTYIPGKSIIYTYGSRAFRDADVVAVYMGVNGSYDNYQIYADAYDTLKNYNTTDNFITVGFHLRNCAKRTFWTQEYHDYFVSRFGNTFLDLRCEGNEKAEEISKVLKYPLTALDYELISDGDWPASWQNNYQTDVHPNSKGHKAYAYLVYKKMEELHYLDF